MILTDEEIDALWLDSEQPRNECPMMFAKALQAAWLAKLASEELPEPKYMPLLLIGAKHSSENVGARFFTGAEFFSAACEIFKLGQSQAYAQGAAAQLAEKPSGYLSQYNLEMLQQGYPQTIVMLEGAKRDVPLYTRRQA